MIFNSNVKSVVLYGAATWRITKATVTKGQTISANINLWERTQQISAEREMGRGKWRWIGYTLRKLVASTMSQALSWNPQEKRGRGRPRNTSRPDFLTDTGLEPTRSKGTG